MDLFYPSCLCSQPVVLPWFLPPLLDKWDGTYSLGIFFINLYWFLSKRPFSHSNKSQLCLCKCIHIWVREEKSAIWMKLLFKCEIRHSLGWCRQVGFFLNLFRNTQTSRFYTNLELGIHQHYHSRCLFFVSQLHFLFFPNNKSTVFANVLSKIRTVWFSEYILFSLMCTHMYVYTILSVRCFEPQTQVLLSLFGTDLQDISND